MVVLCVVLVFYVLEMPLVLSHSLGFLDNKGCTCILCFLIACKNYVSAVCAFNSLVYAALKRANKPETVSIVLILTVCSSQLCTCVNTMSHGSSATPGSAIDRVYIGVGTASGLFIRILMAGPGIALHLVLQMGY